MELLAAEGHEVVGLSEAVALLEAGLPAARTIGLNFDDGFRDVAENALPVLERLGFRATVFVPTGVIDGAASYAWYSQQPPLLDWNEIVQLDRTGTLRFEAHTVSHPNLLLLTDKAARFEIAQSKVELEARLGRPVEAFCYPAGLFGERERGGKPGQEPGAREQAQAGREEGPRLSSGGRVEHQLGLRSALNAGRRGERGSRGRRSPYRKRRYRPRNGSGVS